MKKTSILAVMVLGLGTAGVLAQDGPGNRPGAPRPGGPGGPGGDRPNLEQLFKRLDKNGDGKISREEAPERMARNFDAIDSNHDGFITLEELRAHPPGQGPDGPRGPGGGPGGPGGPGGERPNPEQLFKRLDKNGDGKISKEEAPERMARNFDAIDANHDGFITLEELKAYHPAPPAGGRPNAQNKQ
jgi:collagen type III alpha